MVIFEKADLETLGSWIPTKEAANKKEELPTKATDFGVENYNDPMIQKILSLKQSLLTEFSTTSTKFPSPDTIRTKLTWRTNDEIRALQFHLVIIDGYDSLGSWSKKGIDGILWEKTLVTLVGDRAIQTINNALESWQKLESLKLTAWNGATMKAIQIFLNRLGFRLTPDGYYGPQTRWALVAYLATKTLDAEKTKAMQRQSVTTQTSLKTLEQTIQSWTPRPWPFVRTNNARYLGPKEYDEVDDILQNFTTKVQIPWETTRNEEVTTIMKQVESYFYDHKPPFETVTLSDVFALINYESNFKHEAKSWTWSRGLMQLTTIAFANLKAQKTSSWYDQNYLQQEFEKQGVNYTQIRDGMTKNEDGRWTFPWWSRQRNEIYDNKALNIIIWLATLKHMEKSQPLHSALQICKNQPTRELLKRITKSTLTKNRWIKVNDRDLNTLVDRLATDTTLQRKFSAFARYNGETWGNPQRRWIYALCVLYMGEHVFTKSR
jgi:hypothetical protein